MLHLHIDAYESVTGHIRVVCRWMEEDGQDERRLAVDVTHHQYDHADSERELKQAVLAALRA